MASVELENTSVTEPSAAEAGEAVGRRAAPGPDLGGMRPQDVRRNMRVNILNDSLENTAWADLGIAITPLLVSLGASNALIGLVTGQAFLGVPGLLISPLITRRFRIKKWYYAAASVPWITAIGLLGLIVLFSQQLNLTGERLLPWVVGLVLGAYFLFGFMTLPAREFMAACIPISLRGRMTGYSLCVGGILSIGAAFAARWILQHVDAPASFGYVLLMGWAIYSISVAPVLFARERPTPVENSPRAWSIEMFRGVIADRQFLRYLLLMGLLYPILVNSAQSFIIVYGLRELGMPASAVPGIAIAGYVLRITVSPLGGYLADRFTPQRVMPYMFLLAGLMYLPPVLVASTVAIYASVLLATCHGVLLIPANTSLQYSLPKPEERAGYFSISNLASLLGNTLGPIAAGALCDVLQYRQVFAIAAVAALILFPISRALLKAVVRRS